MTIAELFVKLGITGADKTKKEVAGIGESLKDVGAVAIETKVLIAGVVAALYKFTSEGSKAGTSLIQFSTLTGMSMKELQKYEYAMIQGGGTTDDFRQSITGLQDTMVNMALGKGVPEGLSVIDKVVKFDRTKVKDMFYVIQKLQEFATNPNISPEMKAHWLKSFIPNQNTISSLMQGVFNKKNFDAAPILGDGEAKGLKNIDRGWENLFQKMKIGMAKLNLHVSPALIKSLSDALPSIFKLAEAFAKLAESTHFIEGLAKIMSVMADSADRMATAIDSVNGLFGDEKSADKARKSMLKDYEKTTGIKIDEAYMKKYNEDAVKAYKERHGIVDRNIPNSPALKAFVGPPAPADVTINQSLNFSNVTNPAEIGKSVKKATKEAIGKSKAQKVVN